MKLVSILVLEPVLLLGSQLAISSNIPSIYTWNHLDNLSIGIILVLLLLRFLVKYF